MIFMSELIKEKYNINLSCVEQHPISAQIEAYATKYINDGLVQRKAYNTKYLRAGFINQFFIDIEVISDCFFTCRIFNVLEMEYVDFENCKQYLIHKFNDNLIAINRITRIILQICRVTINKYDFESQLTKEIFIPDKYEDGKTSYIFNIICLKGIPVKTKDYLKRFIMKIYYENNDRLNYNITYLYPFRELCHYCYYRKIENAKSICCEDYRDFLTQNKNRKIRNGSPIYSIVLKFIQFVDFLEANTFWDRDIWDITELKIDKSRIDASITKMFFKYNIINFVDNRVFIKEYLQYLFVHTDLAVSTINARFHLLVRICNSLNKNITEFTREGVLQYFVNLNIPKVPRYEADFMDFQKYLLKKNYINSPLIYCSDIVYVNHKHVDRTVSDFIVKQIFEKLDKMSPRYALAFLILYCTGIRISELVCLEKNCLSPSKGHYYLQTSSQKMRKEQGNLIPHNLYVLIKQYIKTYPNDSKYIFTSINKSLKFKYYPMNKNTFRYKLQEELDKLDIICEDNSKYSIDVHGYRHRISSDLYKRGISIYIIQKVLNHASVQMTLSYVDLIDDEIHGAYKKFYNSKGNELPDSSPEVHLIVEYLNSAINAQALPNGICGAPVKLKKCVHANACLSDCNNFYTCEEYLPVFEKQLLETRKILHEARRNGWVQQIATNEEVEKNILNTISNILKNKK